MKIEYLEPGISPDGTSHKAGDQEDVPDYLAQVMIDAKEARPAPVVLQVQSAKIGIKQEKI